VQAPENAGYTFPVAGWGERERRSLTEERRVRLAYEMEFKPAPVQTIGYAQQRALVGNAENDGAGAR